MVKPYAPAFMIPKMSPSSMSGRGLSRAKRSPDSHTLKLFESNDIQKSEFVKSKFGIYGVCEPSALIMAGFDSKLIYKKTSYNGVTIAVAISK